MSDIYPIEECKEIDGQCVSPLTNALCGYAPVLFFNLVILFIIINTIILILSRNILHKTPIINIIIGYIQLILTAMLLSGISCVQVNVMYITFIIIGLVGSPICYLMISKGKKRFGYDDALDAFGCHGIGGIWGGIATGLFAQTSINSVARWNGLFFGDTQLLVAQIISILVTILVAVAGTLICIAIVRLFTTLRVEKREEQIGLDISQHNETAYPSFNGLD